MNADAGAPVDEAQRHEMEVAGRVAAALMHEFRNVLNPIVSAAWLVAANANDPAKVIELARRIDGFAKSEARIAAKLRTLLDAEAAGRPANAPRQDDTGSASSPPNA